MTDDLKQRGAQVERLLAALPSLSENELWQFLTAELQTAAKTLGRTATDNHSASIAVGYRSCVDDLTDSIDRLKAEAIDIAASLKQEQEEREQAQEHPIRQFFTNLIS